MMSSDLFIIALAALYDGCTAVTLKTEKTAPHRDVEVDYANTFMPALSFTLLVMGMSLEIRATSGLTRSCGHVLL